MAENGNVKTFIFQNVFDVFNIYSLVMDTHYSFYENTITIIIIIIIIIYYYYYLKDSEHWNAVSVNTALYYWLQIVHNLKS